MALSVSLRGSHRLGSYNALRRQLRPTTDRGVSRAPAGPWPLPPHASDLSADQLAAALQRQLTKSAEATAAQAARKLRAASAQPTRSSAIPPRKESRRAARAAQAAADAAAAAQAAERSEAAQAELRMRLASMDEATLTSALRVQLRQSGTFDEVRCQHSWWSSTRSMTVLP